MTDHNEPSVTHDENIAENSLPEAAVAAAEVWGAEFGKEAVALGVWRG